MWLPHVPHPRASTERESDNPVELITSGERAVVPLQACPVRYRPYYTNSGQINEIAPYIVEAARIGFGLRRLQDESTETVEQFIASHALGFLDRLVPDTQSSKPKWAFLTHGAGIGPFTLKIPTGSIYDDVQIMPWEFLVPHEMGMVLPPGGYTMSVRAQIQQFPSAADVWTARSEGSYYVPSEWVPLVTVVPAYLLQWATQTVHTGTDLGGKHVEVTEYNLEMGAWSGHASEAPEPACCRPWCHPTLQAFATGSVSFYMPPRRAVPGWSNFDTAATGTPFPSSTLTAGGRVGCMRWYTGNRCPEYGYPAVKGGLMTTAGQCPALPPADPLAAAWELYLDQPALVIVSMYDASASNALTDHLAPLTATFAGRLGVSEPYVTTWGSIVSRDITGGQWGDGFVRPLASPGIAPSTSQTYSSPSLGSYAYQLSLAVGCSVPYAGVARCEQLRQGCRADPAVAVCGLEVPRLPAAPPPPAPPPPDLSRQGAPASSAEAQPELAAHRPCTEAPFETALRALPPGVADQIRAAVARDCSDLFRGPQRVPK